MDLSGLPYSVAPMRLEDVHTVSRIEQIVFSLPWSTAAFGYEIRHNPASEYLVLRRTPYAPLASRADSLSGRVRWLLQRPQIDNSILGYAGMWRALDEAHVCTLAVRPELQGHGLGELLLVTLIERALQQGASVLTLEVRVSNRPAQSLYTKYGFRVVGRHRAYYSDNREDALVMTTDPITSSGYRERLDCLTTRLRERLLSKAAEPAPEQQGPGA